MPTLRLDSLVRPVRPLADGQVVRDLVRLLKHERPDVVHTHSSKAGIVGRIAARRAGVPVIVHTVHGWSFRDHQAPAVRKAFVASERVAARFATDVVVVSEADRVAAVEERIGHPRQFTVIPNGLDDRRPWPAPIDPAPAVDPVIGTITRLGPPKDTETLVRAFALVHSARPDTRLHVVGDGPERGRLAGLAADLGLDGAVRFLGEREDVHDLLATFSVFVLSSHSEGLPLAVLEAMAAGRPVVASRVGGIPELVDDDRTGLLVAPADPAALSDAISFLLADPARAARLAHAAAVRATEFSGQRMLDRYEALYERALSRR